MGKNLDLPKCPICNHNENVKIKTKNKHNGIYGSGSKSWVSTFCFYCDIHNLVLVDASNIEAKIDDYKDYKGF